ncbi:hypothetical protein BC943DRAFT_358744 [Umbelopsis sp. AD052]|nr:hypothetical protein BC943DRAFT_358744 [Umbelopsis sp. AD052]
MAVYTLPTELISQVFTDLASPNDFFNLQLASKSFNAISDVPSVRRAFLEKLFTPSRKHILATTKEQWSDETFKGICAFLESSNIKPAYTDIRLVIQQVPTSHFCNFLYPSNDVKRAILNLFKSQALPAQSSKPLTIPTLDNDILAQAEYVVYQEATSHMAPRRIFYNVTLKKDSDKFSRDQHFYAIFHHIDCLVAFDDDLNMHAGIPQYKDESIITSAAWESLLSSESVEINNMPTAGGPRRMPVGEEAFSCTLEDLPKPEKPKPCLLRTFSNCELLTDIAKGGLKKGQQFDYVFMYEHEDDDSICMEFCTADDGAVTPRGYLLMTENNIRWQ